MSSDASTLRDQPAPVTATLVLPGSAARTSPPAPPAPPRRRPRRVLRGGVTLMLLLLIGGALGAAGAVLEPILLEDEDSAPRDEVLRANVVARALRPLGSPTLASGDFTTEVQDQAVLDDTTLYVGVARVDATIDFGRMSSRDIRVLDGGTGMRVELPRIVFGPPLLDEARSGAVEPPPSVFDTLFEYDLPGIFHVEPEVDEEALRAVAVDDLALQAETSDLRESARTAALVLVHRHLARFAGLGLDRIDVRFAEA